MKPGGNRLTAMESRALDLAPVMVRGLDGEILLWTRGMVGLYGFSADQALGRISHNLLNTVFPDDLAKIDAELQRQGRWSGELIHTRRDGDICVVASEWSLIPGDDGERAAVLEVNNDVSGQKLAEQDIRRLASIVASSQDAIIGKSLDGAITSWNAAAQRLFGYAEAEVLGRPIEILFPASLLDEAASIRQRLRNGELIEHYETVRVGKDGAEISVSLSISPIRDQLGAVVGAAKIVRDLTAQKMAERNFRDLQDELLHVTRLNDVGQLASAFAHELNQPLSAINNYLSGARRLIASGDFDGAADGCALASAQVMRAGQVISSLREFVQKGVRERRREDLGQVVREGCDLALLGSRSINLSVEYNLDAPTPYCLVDKIQIEQVIVNLVRNAVESMAATPARNLAIGVSGSANGFAEVSIADSGAGISPEIRGRLFQPFVTTKEHGMGVGLSLCRTIVEDHGGSIWADDRPGGGALFRVRLPTAADREVGGPGA